MGVSVLFWALLAAGLLREGTEWALKASLARLLQVRAPDARVHFLRLSAESSAGEGAWRGVAVRWRGATAKLFGRSALETFELGPSLAPLLRVRDLRLQRLWPLMTGTVARVEVSLFRPDWRRFAGGPSEAPGWLLDLPLRLQVPVLSVTTPSGKWQGPAAIRASGGGGRGTWSAELSGALGRLDASGRWSNRGIGGEITTEDPRGERSHGAFSWGVKGLDLQLDIASGAEFWTADVRGRPGEAVQAVLVHLLPGKPSQSLSLRIEPSRVKGQWPVVRDVSGEVRLPDLHVGKGIALLDAYLTADRQGTSAPGETCVALLVRGRLSMPRRSYMLRSALFLRRRANEGFEAALEGQASPAPSPRVDLLADPVSWRLTGRSEGSGTRFGGVVHLGQVVAEAEVFSEGSAWHWSGSARGPAGRGETRGSFEAGRWTSAGTCDMTAPLRGTPPWPLPEGPLKGQFSLGGDLERIGRADLRAAGHGSWRISADQGGWRVAVKGGALRGGGLTVRGLDLEASGMGFPAVPGAGTFQASGHAQDCSISGKDLGSVTVQAALGETGLRAKASSDLKFLEGQASASLSSDRMGHEWRLMGGSVQLVSGAVRFEGVQATWTGRSGDPAHWTAKGARIYGEDVASLKGECLFRLPSGSVDLSASAEHWDGQVLAKLSIGSGLAPDLLVETRGIRASAVPPYIRQWVELPFSTGEGTLEGTVTIPLEDPAEGLALDAELHQVDLEIGGPGRVLPKVSGRFSGLLAGGVFRIPETTLTLGESPVPVSLLLASDAAATRLSFTTPSVPAEQLQSAAFDFLPEMFGYGTFQGAAGVRGLLTGSEDDLHLDLALQAEGLGFLSEDKTLSVKGVQGRLPLSIILAGSSPHLIGYAAPTRAEHLSVLEGFRQACTESGPLSVEKFRFSVFAADHLKLNAVVEDGSLVLRLCDAQLWSGALRGEVRVAVSAEGVRYSGQLLVQAASLKAFCEQSVALNGFMSGTAHATLTFGGDAGGGNRGKALTEIWVDPAGAEPKVISRDFLVKMGGERIRSLLRSDRLEYDRGAFRCGLSGGVLSVYDLELMHQANPVKALIRKDVSFEVRVPQRNSIPLDQLVKNIKNLEVTAGVGRSRATRPRRTK